MRHNIVSRLLIMLVSIALASMTVITGCTRVAVVPPPAIKFAPSPVSLTPDQLYDAYTQNASTADVQYTGKQVWLTSARVTSCTASQDGNNYIQIRWYIYIVYNYNLHLEDWRYEQADAYAICSLELGPDTLADFQDVGNGYLVEAVGECQGMAVETITVQSYFVPIPPETGLGQSDMPAVTYNLVQGEHRISQPVITLKISRVDKTGLPPPPNSPSTW